MLPASLYQTRPVVHHPIGHGSSVVDGATGSRYGGRALENETEQSGLPSQTYLKQFP